MPNSCRKDFTLFLVDQKFCRSTHCLSTSSRQLKWWAAIIVFNSNLIDILRKTREIPQQILQVLVSLLPLAQSVKLPLSFSLPSDSAFETVVPLAAILLDYLVAYVPYHSYPNSLSGVPLDFYEYILTIPSHDSKLDLNHSIIKFSCLASLREDSPQLKPENLSLKLAAIFSERLSLAGAGSITTHVKHTSETVDRVVLWLQSSNV